VLRDERIYQGVSFAAVREAYAQRDHSVSGDWRADRYHPRHPLGRLFCAQNREAMIDALSACEIDLSSLRILDVGCGSGWWLRQLADLGASAEKLTGTDLSATRLALARRKNPGIRWVETEGDLPFPDRAFDLVMQILVFSSIPDAALRHRVAAEMNRVATKGARILWLDLERDPAGKLVTFSRGDVADYFPSASLCYERRVHPRYFRRYYGAPWAVTSLYRLTRAFCDARLVVFEVL
jgi:ubiquinone/menaquinone biosynthesis C-methylase UbiE